MPWRRNAELLCRRNGFPSRWVEAWAAEQAHPPEDPRDRLRAFELWCLDRLAAVWAGTLDEPELDGALAATLVQTYLRESASILAWRYRLADEEWDDLLASAAERALRVFSQRHVEAPQPYLFRTLERAIWEYLRKARREVVTTEMPLARDSGVGPERRASDREIMAAFEACWQTLAPEERRLLEALELQGKSAEAVGRPLGLNANAVNVRKHRIRRRLRDCVAGRTGLGDPFGGKG